MDQRQEIELPAATAIPLGFIANELITNAAKYGTGRIMVRLEPNPEKGYALSVSNDGSGLPEGFDLADHKGLGMRLIQSLVGRIGAKEPSPFRSRIWMPCMSLNVMSGLSSLHELRTSIARSRKR
jgi:two-component sensor histidine kinase